MNSRRGALGCGAARMDMPTALGDFQIHAVLGAGGSGVVYDAVWGPRRVALKVLHAHFVGTEKERAQFFAEAQRLATIGHPHVVKVHAVGALPDGRPYLAMELLVGETLASVLGRGPLALADALPLFGELCGAVAALHAQGLVHRDLKPENVFVVGGKHAVLLDFGIAKEIAGAASTVTQDGGVRGTPAYMAPERFFGQPAGVATDVYELAVICYAMLAGRLPWDDLLDPEARLSPRPLGELVGDVPSEVDVELRRALSTRAANRPESAGALAAAVHAAAVGGAASAPREPKSAETAPMRKDAVQRAALAGEGTPVAKPWFAERSPTTDRGRTPLAWAPDPAPTPSAAPRRAAVLSRRLAYGGGAVAAIAAGLGAFVIVGGAGGTTTPAAAVGPRPLESPTQTAAIASGSDPWASEHRAVVTAPAAGVTATPITELAQGPARTRAAYRAEAAAALGHLPPDTKAVIAVSIDAVMGHAPLAKLVHLGLDDDRVGSLLAIAPPCARALIGESAWLTYGAPRLDDSARGTMIIGGRWNTDDVVTCFGATAAPAAGVPGVWQVHAFGYLARIDAHTVLVTNRTDLGAPAISGLATHAAPPPAAVRAAVTAFPADSAIAVVVDRTSGDDFTSTLELPQGVGIAGSLRIEADSIDVAGTASPLPDRAIAQIEAKVRPQLTQLVLFGEFKIGHTGDALHLDAHVSDAFLATLASTGLGK